MRPRRVVSWFLFTLFLTSICTAASVRADDDEPEDYDVKARVVRISLIGGEVNLKRAGNTDWERARVNFALIEGDTIATDNESLLEIQIDARNFVRLGSRSFLRITTLRDEGVALGIIEGTAVIRLSRFDRQKEYFELDAPRSTLAIEKNGLYRVDVAREGRVRFTVRDGGSARIYSDTSAFALRDGRSAELIVDGDNAGDWEFATALTQDGLDKWVDDRERYLAQRLRYDVQYYDEHVWGAEDLDAYGDWFYANDYGWIWRPRGTDVYNDWAPYRYGRWTWCPPYGWTWVGYEPWGWAPYHYGRWVYYNNSWAWCPRSRYYRNRGWWRPALVSIHISFGNTYCWYPLSYYHRDPHSNYYQRHPERLRALRYDELAQLRRVNPAYLRAVTSAPARAFGDDAVRAERAEALVARRALSSQPLRGGLPARPVADRDGTSTTDRSSVVRPPRSDRVVDVPGRVTGAATRTPGAPLDDELRRSRVFNGREPRTASPADSSNVGPPENRPTGAVTRPPRNIDSTPATPDLSAPSNDSSKPTRSRVTTPASPSTPDEDRTDRRPALPDRRTSDNARPAETSDTPPERVGRPAQPGDDGEKRSRDKRERIETSRPVERPE